MLAFYILCIIWMILQEFDMVHPKIAPWNSRWEWLQRPRRHGCCAHIGPYLPSISPFQARQERFPTSRPCLQSVSWGVWGQLLRPIINASCGLRPGVSTTKRPTLLLTRSTSCKTDLLFTAAKEYGTRIPLGHWSASKLWEHCPLA